MRLLAIYATPIHLHHSLNGNNRIGGCKTKVNRSTMNLQLQTVQNTPPTPLFGNSKWMTTPQNETPNCLYKKAFWLIWFINQRALYNHALSIMHCHCWHHPALASASLSVHTSPGTWLDIETSYLVHICTYVPHICTSNI